MQVVRGGFYCVVLSAILACGSPDAEPAGAATSVRDSAGIRIVENPEHAPDSAGWSIDTVPSVELGGEESRGEAYVFGRIADAVRLNNGNLVVADEQAGDVRLFDASGTFLGKIARSGDGPGEVRGPNALHVLPGDTILVVSAYTGAAAAYFDGEGRFVRFWHPPESGALIGSDPPYRPPSLIGALADGSLVVRVARAINPIEEAQQPRVPTLIEYPGRVLRLSPENTLVADFGMSFRRQVYYKNFPNPGWVEVDPPYLPQGREAVWATQVYVADGEHFEIRVYDQSGVLNQIIIKSHTPVAMPSGWSEERWGELAADIGNESEVAWIRQAPPPPTPPWAPALDRVLVDGLGNTWVRSHAPGQPGPAQWFIFGPDGRLGHSLRTDIAPRQVGSDYVLAIVQDGEQPPRVAVYPLRKN
jgi:hypothetical protein